MWRRCGDPSPGVREEPSREKSVRCQKDSGSTCNVEDRCKRAREDFRHGASVDGGSDFAVGGEGSMLNIESTEGEVEIVQKGLSGDRTGEIGIRVLDPNREENLRSSLPLLVLREHGGFKFELGTGKNLVRRDLRPGDLQAGPAICEWEEVDATYFGQLWGEHISTPSPPQTVRRGDHKKMASPRAGGATVWIRRDLWEEKKFWPEDCFPAADRDLRYRDPIVFSCSASDSRGLSFSRDLREKKEMAAESSLSYQYKYSIY